MVITIGLEQQLRYNILLPIIIGTVVILITTLYPLNTSTGIWESTTYDYIYDSSLSATQTRITYMKKYLNEYFDVTKNNMNTIHDYIQSSASGDLNVETNYKNYFAVNTFNFGTPPKDVDGYYLASASFLKNINNDHDLSLVDSYSLNQSTIFDNAIRATFKSTNLYTTMYFGFERNGLHRRYPYADLTSFVTYTDTCYYNNQPITTYDPRCRIWYGIAKYDDNIHYTAPYRNALTGQVRITASRRVLNGTELLGVFGIDFLMQEIDDIIDSNIVMSSGYMFIMSSDGSLISYPNIDRSGSVAPTVITMESDINANTWYNILDEENVSPLYTSVIDTNGKQWIIVYVYMEETDYYIVMMYPESDVSDTKDEIFGTVTKTTLNGTIVLPIISGIIMLISFCVINTMGKHYTEPIRQLLNDVKQIGTADLDIELGNRAPVSSEFTALRHNFKHLLTAVQFGNDAYYGGNMQKALESYENAEKLMSTLGVVRGLSVCYNNKANVYKQMGKFREAEEFYLKSISLVKKLIGESNENSTVLAYKVSLSYKLMNLGVLYKDTNQIPKALENFAESISLARETDNALGISKISGNLAQLYLDVYRNDKQKIKEAHDLIYDAYETIKDKGDEISLQYASMNIGIYEKNINKKYELALSWFTNVLRDHAVVDMYVKQVCLQNVQEILILLGRTAEARQISQQTTTVIPNDVLFVLDCSGSMAGQFINTCKSSIKDIMVNYLQDSDNISMMTFNSNVSTIFSNETKQNHVNLYTKIDNIKADGGTAFYDALYHAINEMDKSGDATKWIVALTDGDDQHSKRKPEEVIKLVKQKSVNIVIMTVGKLANADIIKKICNSVKNGGKGILIEIEKNPAEINKAFAKVAKLIVGQLNVESL